MPPLLEGLEQVPEHSGCESYLLALPLSSDCFPRRGIHARQAIDHRTGPGRPGATGPGRAVTFWMAAGSGGEDR